MLSLAHALNDPPLPFWLRESLVADCKSALDSLAERAKLSIKREFQNRFADTFLRRDDNPLMREAKEDMMAVIERAGNTPYRAAQLTAKIIYAWNADLAPKAKSLLTKRYSKPR